MKKKFLSIFIALVLVFTLGLVTAVPAAAAEVSSVFQSGGDRLVETQNEDGGWGFPLTGDSAPNMIGPIGIGLAETYRQTNDPLHLAALGEVGTFLLTRTNNFTPWDGYLAVQLDNIFEGTTYTDFVKTNFYDLLALGTYVGTSGTYDTEGYIFHVGYAWSLGIGLVSAEAVGIDQSEVDKWITGVKTALLGLIDPSDLYYPSDLAGGLYGLAYAGETEFTGDVGGNTMSSVADLAAELASLQAPSGAFRDGVELAQDTAYALLALNEFDRSVYIDNIIRAGVYLGNAQLETGGWINGEDDPDPVGQEEINGMTAEALWALASVPVRVTIGENGYYSIQDAIDAALAGDTISVAAGTYTEHLMVDVANLTLRSVSGDAAIALQVVDNQGMKIASTANGFTLGGEEGHGFTITGDGGRLIELENSPSGVTISYNEIDSTGVATYGVSVGAAGAEDLTIINNDFTADSSDGSIFGPDMVNVTVSNNTFTGPGGYAVEFVGVTGTSTISGNTISGYGNGIFIFGASVTAQAGTTGVSGLTISDNTVSECVNGIRLGYVDQSENIDEVTVTQNTLTANDKAIRISDGTHVLASYFVIEYNDISGSTTWGLQNEHATELVTAENNWWGSASGPSGEGPGLGDAVSVNVDFTPWLLSEGGEPVVTYTDYISVPDGWSLISPDRAWADWEALGSDLVLTYDTDILVPAFVEPQSSSLSPLSAIYIKTTGGGLLGMNYPDYDLGMYATNLEEGWNLIGIPETGALPGAILSPLRYGANNETALATLANQSNYNLSDVLTFYVDAFDWANIEGLTLDASDGYWAYMNVAKEFGVVVVP